MSRSQTAADYALLRGKIRQELKKAIATLSKRGYESQHVSPKEFFDYMTG